MRYGFLSVFAFIYTTEICVRGSNEHEGLLDPRALPGCAYPGWLHNLQLASQMVIQYNRHIRVKACILYLQLFVASCFRASVNIHAPNKTCPNQLKRPMDMSLLLCSFSRRKGSRQNKGVSTLERPYLPSLGDDGCPGCDSYATTGYCRPCTAVACPSMYRYPLYLHHRSDGTNM